MIEIARDGPWRGLEGAEGAAGEVEMKEARERLVGARGAADDEDIRIALLVVAADPRAEARAAEPRSRYVRVDNRPMGLQSRVKLA